MENKEAQHEELLVLQSIYDQKYFIVEDMNPPCGRFSADVQLSDPFYVNYKSDNLSTDCENYAASSRRDCEEFEVNYLPPINLYFEYPESYPSDSPPAFLLSCCWLSYEQLSKLCKHLDNFWDESSGEVILFQWIQFLKEEALSFLGIEGSLDITELSNFNLKADILSNVPSNIQTFYKKRDSARNNSFQNSQQNCNSESDKKILRSFHMPTLKPSVSGGNGPRDQRAFLDIADGKVLKNMLKDYNELRKIEHFQDSWQLCNICFANKQGSEFVTFRLCQHFFCKDCLKSYFELLIIEGNVSSLSCPHDKCNTEADGTVVKQIVSRDIFERYDSLLLARTLDTMADLSYCPRKACQCAVLIDVSGRIGRCPACEFVFCPFCKMAYHGVAPCKFSPSMRKQVSSDYLEGDANMKIELERCYGARVLKSLVEEVLSEKWIGSNSKNCPHCNASIEKTEGCNKMTCFRCGTYFCWLCTKRLPAANPYHHYSERGSECYERLFPANFIDDNDEFMFEPGEFLNF